MEQLRSWWHKTHQSLLLEDVRRNELWTLLVPGEREAGEGEARAHNVARLCSSTSLLYPYPWLVRDATLARDTHKDVGCPSMT